MSCPACGHEVEPGAAYCGACGRALPRLCARCAAPLRPSARFCEACGQPLAGQAAGGAGPGPPLLAASATERYRMQRRLGEGGKKRVYLAHDTRLERDVAIAFLKTEGLDDAGLARLRREARAMGRLGDHPNVVTIYDVGEEDGRPYIVSQYMAGGSIDDLLARSEKRRLPLERALRLAEDMCRALEHAHARGIVHRDLKPANIWLTEDGTAKLGDFGLALALGRSRLTVEGMMVGTVAYMPPEQALGRAPDGRSDLYALGAVLYEMLTGRPPFLGDDAVAVISQHINTPPVAPSWHNAEVPRALEALILRLLAKVPEERPESASAVREALAAIARAQPSAAAPAVREELNPLDRLASGAFVGREREMDELRAGLENTLSGRGGLLLLVGEPGIGKTRTAEELVTYAQLRRAQVLWGRCHEGGGAPAFWPWVQAIRAYVHDRAPDALRVEMGSGAADIAQLVSEVRERLPGLTTPPTLEPEQARFRLFDSITTFLKNAAKDQPLVLVLDDLHWADKPSLLLLQFLARELRGMRVLVVGTYRDVDLRRQHPLSHALGDLAREQLSSRVVLRGLTAHDVARFIEVTAGLKAPPSLVEAVHEETEGNPFFVNEVVRLLVAEGRLEHPERVRSWSVGIPQSVREVVGRRLDHLSAECNGTLTVASVIGREFGLDVLERVTGTAAERLLELLDEARAARVVVEVPGALGRHAFSHALIRETLYEELSTTRRVRLHRQLGEVLEALYAGNPEPHLAELAHHFFEAAQGGDVDRAIAYAVRAGDRAAAKMAHEEAARHYEVGLQALELREHSAEGVCALLLKLSETLWRAGEYDRAKEASLRAAGIARKVGNPMELARAALGFGGRLVAFAAVLRDDALVGFLEEALERLGDQSPGLRARVLGRLAEEITFSDPYERRQALCREAVEVARRLGDPAVLGAVLRSSHWALWVAENAKERLALADEIIESAGRAGDLMLLAEGHALRHWDLIELTELPAAMREYELLSGLAEETRQPYFQWYYATLRVLFALLTGRYGEVEALAQQALQTGQEAQNPNATLIFGLHLAVLFNEQGRFEELTPVLGGALGMYPLIGRNLHCAVALQYTRQGRESEARQEFEALAANDFADLPRNLAWLFCIAYLGEVAAWLRDLPRCERLYELLRPFAARNVTIGPVLALGSAARYLGVLAAATGRWEEAVCHFEDALVTNARMGMRGALAHTQVEYAEGLLGHGQPGAREKALELLNRALDGARDMGMRSVLEKALALKLQAQGVASREPALSIDAVVSLVAQEPPDLRAHAAPDGTVTILFTDIEGSTAMTVQLGDQRAIEVLRAHNAIVRSEVAQHGGFEVKSQGDGFMLAFQSARRAVRCAIALQRAFHAYSAEHPETPLRIRVGLHTGEAIKEADDFFGKAVILAARIAAQARGGEILISSLLHELTESVGDVRFGAAREVDLKGLTGRHTVHAVEWAEP